LWDSISTDNAFVSLIEIHALISCRNQRHMAVIGRIPCLRRATRQTRLGAHVRPDLRGDRDGDGDAMAMMIVIVMVMIVVMVMVMKIVMVKVMVMVVVVQGLF
jgi:hypothetical protein